MNKTRQRAIQKHRAKAVKFAIQRKASKMTPEAVPVGARPKTAPAAKSRATAKSESPETEVSATPTPE